MPFTGCMPTQWTVDGMSVGLGIHADSVCVVRQIEGALPGRHKCRPWPIHRARLPARPFAGRWEPRYVARQVGH